ncbi:daunorubicin resistance protein DrrA family ABC transporter ATP-binding protein [Desulfosarcina ovata subsp. sediminis]|uniref:Daunorubicin resistance protein DrrA family ABC transporter ATP-binding protein n=1 Tax=Desulfosarcina ovata subsp. sediminis TaxID=885957 RepID=A0A5K7ZN80_9BACT|nr:ATP-binding cassette domain-containing protein [Desulfosarcina ovata]BBO81935.1 daunorubicin resistance protein DrrA family ABC transporter ATP-binding protein [Desulfosarcina ovata subsp. sediminis]
MRHIIEVQNLSKTFANGVSAVREASFHVQEGEIFGFLGPNGAGKSTTIMMLTTLLAPSSGRAKIAGFDVRTQANQVRPNIGYISQDLAVDDHLTGRQNLMLQAGFYHLPKKKAVKRIEVLLDLVDLASRADDAVETYSGGMRKRLDIVSGLIHQPRVLFLDEPTLGLDIQTRRQIWEYIDYLRTEKKMTLFLTTHYMEEADFLCDRVAIIDNGTIKAMGSPGHLKNQIGTEMVRMRFDESDGDGLSDALRRIGELDVVERIEKRGGQFTAVVKSSDEAIPCICRSSLSTGVKISFMAAEKTSLADVYMAFTGKALRDESGGGADAHRTRRALQRMRS